MKFVVTPLPASDDILSDRIRETASRSSSRSQATTTTTSSSLATSAAPINSVGPQNITTTPTTTDSSSTQHNQSNQQQATCINSQPPSAASTLATSATAIPPSNVAHQQLEQYQTTCNNNSSHTTTWNAIKSVPVSQITVGPRHIALLLEDGRICRASYQVLADRLEFPPVTHHATQISSSSMAAGGVNNSSVAGNHQAHIQAQHSLATATAAAAASNPQVNAMSKAPLVGTAGGAMISNSPGLGNVISPGGVVSGLDSRAPGSAAGLSGSGPGAGQSSVGGPSPAAGSGIPSPSFHGRVNISPQVSGLSVQHRQAARRGRMLRQTASRGRGAASVILGSRAVIPAQYVPEDLINQAQVVLQGKPRSAIVRELQRTNLDVNSAVNNLLSSDNEDPEDMDESQDYLPNEDLMSLLDSSVSLPTGPTSVLIDAETVFPEDVFNSYSASRIRPTSIRHAGSGRSNSDREGSLASELEIRRMTNRDPSQSRRWLEHALRDAPGADSSNSRLGSATPTDFTLHHKNESNQSSTSKKSTTHSTDSSPIHISEAIELWPGDKKFVQIACMHSELIAISSTGQIHQWKWSEPMPYEGIRYGDVINYHPRVAQLNLTHEKIQMLSASCIRATVITESSKVATWVDETINIVANKLEHCAQSYPEFQRGDRISQLHTCSLYSCVRLESGALYWWGVAPFSQRKKNWKKIQSKACKASSSNSNANDISVGSIVCLKNGPSFGDGAIGFTTKDGIPRVGRLTMSAWSITDTCTFKIIQPNDRKTHLSQQSSHTSETKTRARKMLGQPLDFSGNATDEQPPTSPGMSKNCTSERLEMPPPPSPASSTCSEPGCSPSHKRKHKHHLSLKDEDRCEEQWNLKDVIFLEEVKKPPNAKVIKLDGNTALVRFNQRDPFGQQIDSDVNAYLQECRMIRKDELQLAKETTSSSRIIDCQRSPKKINIPASSNFLTFTVSNNGIHALVKNGHKIEYKMFQLASGKVSKSLYFSTETNAFLGRDPSLITLYASGESDVAVTLRDGNGSLYPLAKDFLDSLKEPQPLDMAPVQAMNMAVHPLKDPGNPNRTVPTLIIAMALESQILIPAVLRSDPEFVRLTLASLDREPVSQQIVASEKIDLNRNILHAAVYTCAPTPTRGDKNKTAEDPFEAYPAGISRVLNESIKRSRGKQGSLPPSNSAPSTLDLSADGDRAIQNFPETKSALYEAPADWSNSIFNRFDIDPTEQKQSAHIVLLILVDCPILRPYLKDLMIQRDAHGMTPFMSAVSCRAYTAAMILLDLAQWIINQEENKDLEHRQRLFGMMIFPPGTNLDNNPLQMLCANDTCSFTWTGAQHINQDIFECKTCGLTRTLCCCTECARTCHKGHDCRLKKTSPTAYCDCWEKCKCKSLVAGSHFTRFKLLERLLGETDLVTYPDSKGESILLFLVQTVGRQMVEQRQYGPERSSRSMKRDDRLDMPDHDLSPPRFARKALHRMLGEWLALRTVIMAGTGPNQNLANASRLSSLLNAEDQIFLSSQQGTALLDRFTHSVLIKIGPEMLDVLLTTIIRESSSTIPGRSHEARSVARRFVRSVARNGVVLSVELSPINYSQHINMLDFPSVFNQVASTSFSGGLNTSSSWKPTQQPASILQKCRKVFQALLPIAAEELAEIADALISPVRLGVPRPTAPFSLVNSMAEATQGSEEIFVVEPVVIPNQSNIEAQMPLASSNRQAGSGGNSQSAAISTNSDPPPPLLQDNAPPSTDRIRDLLYDNEIVMDAVDSEDAEASNNTFRPSNNGESESDSDSNPDDASYQSNLDPSGPRSTTTGATAGSEVGASTAYFSEPDSGDSSNGEDDDEESDANDTEQDNDDMAFAHDDHHFTFNRRGALNPVANNAGIAPGLHESPAFRSTNLGQQLHWALRHRDHSFYPPRANSSLPSTASRLASIGLSDTYSYLEGAPVRRSVMTNSSQSANNAASSNSELSMSTTAVGLARAFSIIIRSISDLIPILKESERSDSALTINQLKVSPTEAATIICNLEKKLNPIWEWLFKVMDSTESQLRFGCALTNGIQAAAAVAVAPQHHSRLSSTQPPPLPPASHHQHHSRGSSIPTISNPPPEPPRPYVPSRATDLIQLDHAMIDRMNAQLAAAGVHRRIPHRLPEEAAQQLLVGARDDRSRTVTRDRERERELSDLQPSVSLHNPTSAPVSNSAVGSGLSRPQALTGRANLSGANYVTRMTLNDNAPVERLDGTAARRDFLSYMISLIRGHGNEHHDSLPVLDVSSLRHIAYVFDAYIYYLQALSRNKISKPNDDWTDDEDLSPNENQGPNHQFFRRSESTLFLDSNVPDPFSVPLSEALPLAEQPHLLQPNSRREDLFGAQRSNLQDVNLESLPMQLSLSTPSRPTCPQCMAKQQVTQNLFINPNIINSEMYARSMTGGDSSLCPIHKKIRSTESSSEIQHTALLGRWRLTVELFGREFLDDVGAEPGSILTDLVGFPIKEIRFRKEMERLRNDSAPREISLTNVDRDKNLLIRQTIKELNSTYHMAERPQCRRNLELPLLACSKVKVSFKDEKGEGNGVARSFYTAFCEAVLSNEKLANLDAPLFYQPGLRNFYSPRQGDPTPDKLNAYRNVGRVIGICLSQSEICPIQLNRHAIKYILKKPISWHDLAFFDPVLYESLRQLILDAKTNPDAASSLQALDLRFCVDLSVEEGGGQVELTPGGRNIEVTPSNVYEYVRRYALKRMLKSQEKALQAMRQGVMDVLPPTALDNLTAEDFRLLLNGVGEINVQTLINYTSFIDDRGTSAGKRNSIQVEEQLGYFKKWFWSIVEKMTTKERQDLVYFWTGSPSLPASEEGFQPMPTVSIRPAEDLHLPTSNVCIFRLYIPLYSSKAILRSKLLIAIKEKNFGFI